MRLAAVAALAFMLAGSFAAADGSDGAGDYDLTAGGTIIMLRHSTAPGTGDPRGFDLDDITTQRNLSDQGRAQAKDLGAHLRNAGLGTAPVFSSAWWRCLETAELLGLGEPEVFGGLNSFFGRPSARDEILQELRSFFESLPTDGDPVVLVTHQVNITAVTGAVPASGCGVVLRANGTGSPDVIATIENGGRVATLP